MGIGTVLADDPLLTARATRRAFQPLRVVLDSRLRIPPHCRLVQTAREFPLLIFTLSRTVQARKSRADDLRRRHCQLIPVEPDPDDGRVDLRRVLQELARRGVTDVLVEGGAQILQAFWQRKLADKLLIYIAPVIVGASSPTPRLELYAPWQRPENSRLRHLGTDTLIEIFLDE